MDKSKAYYTANLCTMHIPDKIIITVYLDKSGYEYEIYNFTKAELLDIKKLNIIDQKAIKKILIDLLESCCIATIKRREKCQIK